MRHIVAREIKSETQLWWFFNIKDFFFCIFYLIFGWFLSNFIASKLNILFWIFHLFMMVFLIMPSLYNTRRKNWQSFAIILKLDKNIYQPCFYDERNKE